MIRTAIIGCGKIADDHASQIARIRDTRIVGACDAEPLMARQLADRFPVDRCYETLDELLEAGRPDVVHVTTPPQSHLQIAQRCLAAGAHVYVEKPFTVDAAEAARLVSLAEERGLKVTVGHDDQYRHAARRMRALIADGYLGSEPLHMESHYGYEFGPDAYAAQLLADSHHWIRALPGQLLQNVISHGVARLAEYLPGDHPRVAACGFTSPRLRTLGENGLIDELRVLVRDGAVTAYFTFSSQLRPGHHQFRVYGSTNGLLLDQDQETLIRLPGKRYTSYLEKFVPPVGMAGQYIQNWARNLGCFMLSDFHMKSGMKYLIESFYRSISNGTPVPIPYREILLTARIMDSIIAQVYQQSPAAAAVRAVTV